jgi:hypothetical protein
MAAAKHTPGPWVADEYPHGDVWQIKYGKRGNWIAEVMIDGDHKGAAADARLIASAPDLLEALVLALPYVEDASDSASPADQEIIRAAIAKATGEAA